MVKRNNMTSLGRIAAAILCLAGTVSCIRDRIPECPPMQLTVSIEDRNYFNIDDAVKLGMAERKADDLPFREYVSTLYYIIRDSRGNIVAEQKNKEVDNDSLTQTILLPSSLPYGKYSITVWGNMTSEEPLSGNADAAGMEISGAAANDIYLASADFYYQYGSEHYTVMMRRTKGNLMIKAEGIPDNIDFSVKLIENIYSMVTKDFTYAGSTDIRTELGWDVRNEIQTQTLMCPSPYYDGTRLSVIFMDSSTVRGTDSNGTVIQPKDVNITMSRNQITIMRYLYDSVSDDFTISVYMDDGWVTIHEMGIE